MERSLLQLSKDSSEVAFHHWSLPAILTCPGATEVCQRHCFAIKGRYCFPKVRTKLAWNYEQTVRDDFAPRMITEIASLRCKRIWIHMAGDFYSKEYVQKWTTTIEKCQGVQFFWESRSWRFPEIERELLGLLEHTNCSGWFSLDAASEIPGGSRVKLGYLQASVEDLPTVTCDVLKVASLSNVIGASKFPWYR